MINMGKEKLIMWYKRKSDNVLFDSIKLSECKYNKEINIKIYEYNISKSKEHYYVVVISRTFVKGYNSVFLGFADIETSFLKSQDIKKINSFIRKTLKLKLNEFNLEFSKPKEIQGVNTGFKVKDYLNGKIESEDLQQYRIEDCNYVDHDYDMDKMVD